MPITPITSADPESRTPDLVAENIAKLKTLFPELITEGKEGASVNVDVLKALVGDKTLTDADEKYGLNWFGKRRARQLALTPSTGTLRPCPKDSEAWDTTKNLMIEGDNLEVLKLLQKSYANRVKLIYIDPPYNTSNDFVYPDDYQDNIKNYLMRTGQINSDGRVNTTNKETSGRFHTDWLDMIYPRLILARGLLSEDGVILVSIDDNEEQNVKQILDDVFGEENYIASFIWEKGRKNDAQLVSVGHEYIVVYAKSIACLKEKHTLWREEKPGAREIWDKYLELRQIFGGNNMEIERHLQGWFSSLPKTHPSKKWSRYKRIDANGPWRDRDISWPGGDGPRYDVIHPKTGLPCKVPERGWIYSTQEEMQRQIKLGLVEFRDDHSEPPFRKAHIRPVTSENSDIQDGCMEDDDDGEFATQVRGSYFYKQSQVSVKYLRDLLNAKAFNNPKDFVELSKLFDYVTSSDTSAIVLDFFAGSGSSGHAVMAQNAADSGNRRYILVQLPEPLDPENKDQKTAATFCDSIGKSRTIAEITKERLRRAAKKIRDDNPMFAGDLGFRVFKLDSSNIKEWDPHAQDLAQTLEEHVQNLKQDRSEGDILFELLLKLGIDLSTPIEERNISGHAVHAIGVGTLVACLSKSFPDADAEPVAQGIIEWLKELAPKAEDKRARQTTIVFRDSAFESDVGKTNLAAILNQHGIENVRSI